MSIAIELRPATMNDRFFVDGLLFITMDEYVRATWPNDDEAQCHYYQINKFDHSNTQIIQVNGRDVGRISTTRHGNDCFFIDELHIVPDYQGRGIGKEALAWAFRQAEEMKLPVRATILVVNKPSQRLCLGMGFQLVGEKEHRLQIQYIPASIGAG